MKKSLFIVCLLIVLVLSTGCPAGIPSNEEIENGNWFRQEIDAKLWRDYDINIKKDDLPKITLTYNINQDNDKKATFALDGFDPEKKIGYKFVTNEDKEIWDKSRSEGDSEAPDLEDFSVLQNEALEYDFPVLIFWNPDYYKSMDDVWLFDEISNLFASETLTAWKDSNNS